MKAGDILEALEDIEHTCFKGDRLSILKVTGMFTKTIYADFYGREVLITDYELPKFKLHEHIGFNSQGSYEELIKQFKGLYARCTCGAASVGSDKHSWHCEKVQ